MKSYVRRGVFGIIINFYGKLGSNSCFWQKSCFCCSRTAASVAHQTDSGFGFAMVESTPTFWFGAENSEIDPNLLLLLGTSYIIKVQSLSVLGTSVFWREWLKDCFSQSVHDTLAYWVGVLISRPKVNVRGRTLSCLFWILIKKTECLFPVSNHLQSEKDMN